MKGISRFVPFLFLSQVSFLRAWGVRPEYETRNIDGTEYILPNMETLIHFLEQDMGAWRKEMTDRGFVLLGRDDEKSPFYSKGKMRDKILVINKDSVIVPYA